MVDLGPTHPDDPRAVATRRERDTERTYSYVQKPRSLTEATFRRPQRCRRYVVRVTEDRAGRRVVHTERFDPERGSGPNLVRVDLRPLPWTITLPMMIFGIAVFIILTVVLPFPFNSIVGVYWAWSLSSRMGSAVERARMAKYLRRLPETLPPLLSEEELDARVFTLANPDEDRTFDEPPPTPMAKGLRDPAWKRWEDRLEELSDQEYRVGQTAYTLKRDTGFADGPDHPLYQLIRDVRDGIYNYPEQIDYLVTGDGVRIPVRETAGMTEALRPQFENLGREVLGPERVAELEDHRRAAAHGESMLDRRFTARTDCADGHVGEHPILSTFTDSSGRKRVRRGCPWCPSIWSELV